MLHSKYPKDLAFVAFPIGVSRLPEILIVSRTVMGARICIGGYDVGTNRSLRLSAPGSNSQPADSPLQIGQVWEMRYTMRNSAPPFVEDADAVALRYVRDDSVEAFVDHALVIADGDTGSLYNGMLHWKVIRLISSRQHRRRLARSFGGQCHF